ncbi:chloride channel protein [Candidatus Parabeggiatoa sp. HSG14]|uniref:chloride channel protein n=1 Tax=Candidatus Parabeggiatoa sp. HSG14 TaxID=3055593 RepID=UPI0025A79D3C|nr:chloride channel protein [Thiotrichales bacterium HSG14]
MALSQSGNISSRQSFIQQLIFKFKHLPDFVIVTTLAVIVGIGAGFGAILTEWLVEIVHDMFFEKKLWGLLEGTGTFYLILVPAMGAAIFGPIIYYFAREAKGHGVSEVLEAVSVGGGRIRPRVAVVKSVSSAFCIGSGGSVGLEGPIAQIGSAVGSTVGQFFSMTEEKIRLLLGCGAGAAIAATFHAPITGTIFALEIILGHLEARYFSAVVISAVIADTIAQLYKEPLVHAPTYQLISSWELLLYALLGVLAGLGAIGFSKALHGMEDLWGKVHVSEYVKPILGGLILGVVGFFTFQDDSGFPYLFGMGYEGISGVLSLSDPMNTVFTLKVVFAIFLLKIFTTSLTLGSGGSGGTFTPALFMGAMLGASFGHIVNLYFPGIVEAPGAYALAGLAAFFGGAAHAPMTAILVAFELTHNYEMILPIMLTTVVSTLVAQTISPTSIYTHKLTHRGIPIRRGAPGLGVDVMENVTVGEAMNTELQVIPLTMSVEELMERFATTHRHGYPVVDDAGELAGVVSIKDLDSAIAAGKIKNRTVADIATTDLLVAYPYEPISAALQKLSVREISRLPVVEEEGSRQLIGIVLRTDIIDAYNNAMIKNRVQKQEE